MFGVWCVVCGVGDTSGCVSYTAVDVVVPVDNRFRCTGGSCQTSNHSCYNKDKNCLLERESNEAVGGVISW